MSLHCLPPGLMLLSSLEHPWSIKQEYSRQSAAICRMADLQLVKQLEQLDGEIAELTAKVEAAKKDWLSARDPQRKADLKDVYDYAKKKKEYLLEDRRALQLKLPNAGEHTPLFPCQQHRALTYVHGPVVGISASCDHAAGKGCGFVCYQALQASAATLHALDSFA